MIREHKSPFEYCEKLLRYITTAFTSEEEIVYFHSLLNESEENIWELEMRVPDLANVEMDSIYVDLHQTFLESLWDEEEILTAMKLSYLLTQAADQEQAEEILDVWLSSYWDKNYSSPQDLTNIDHIRSILQEGM